MCLSSIPLQQGHSLIFKLIIDEKNMRENKSPTTKANVGGHSIYIEII
jgi:hypothetical protein